jgi:hypothetical protein
MVGMGEYRVLALCASAVSVAKHRWKLRTRSDRVVCDDNRQMLENVRLQSCEGLALPFLLNWLFGEFWETIVAIEVIDRFSYTLSLSV